MRKRYHQCKGQNETKAQANRDIVFKGGLERSDHDLIEGRAWRGQWSRKVMRITKNTENKGGSSCRLMINIDWNISSK
jgi:hypothetical protein